MKTLSEPHRVTAAKHLGIDIGRKDKYTPGGKISARIVEDCEHAIKLGYSALVQHLKHWEGCPSQDDEEKGYLQALKDFEDKLFSTTEE